MFTYRYTGEEPRHPAPPLVVDGELEPGVIVESPDPIDDPLFEPVDENDLPDAAVKAMHDEAEAEAPQVENIPRRRSARIPKE